MSSTHLLQNGPWHQVKARASRPHQPDGPRGEWPAGKFLELVVGDFPAIVDYQVVYHVFVEEKVFPFLDRTRPVGRYYLSMVTLWDLSPGHGVTCPSYQWFRKNMALITYACHDFFTLPLCPQIIQTSQILEWCLIYVNPKIDGYKSYIFPEATLEGTLLGLMVRLPRLSRVQQWM